MRWPSDSRRVLLATRSRDKLREIREILADTGLTVVSLDEEGLPHEAEEEEIEAFDTFVDNALAKATYFCERSGLPTLADDSGLAVDALDGKPGVRSRRWSGRTDLTGVALDRANNETLLAALRGQPEEQRTAHYVCAAAFARPAAPPLLAVGTVSGRILTEPRGTGGFGYDPLFYVPALDRTFAEVDAVTKHAHSHRGRAFRALAVALR